MPFRLRRKAVTSGAIFEAHRQVRRYRSRTDSPWHRPCSPDHLRGIDFYRPGQLLWVIANAMRGFREVHGQYPDLVNPTSFCEKIFWFKFFGEVRVPHAGDKLAVRKLIPPHLQEAVVVPPVVWRSRQAVLPDDDRIAPGVYYLKANVGSGFFKRIRFPLAPDERAALEREAGEWLTSLYGLFDGEWWYQTYEPILFLEESIAGDVDTISWNFFVLNGHVPQVTMFMKHADGRYSSTWLDRQFKHLAHQGVLPPVEGYHIPPQGEEMLAIAERIGESFSAIRVDFLQGDDGKAYLCELTFAPGNALTRRHPDVERLLSDPWRMLK